MIRKIIASTVALFLVLSFFPAATGFANSDVRVTVDRLPVSFPDQLPVISQGRTLVPVRGVFEQMGFVVEWDNSARQATLTSSTHTVVITIGSSVFTTNGVSHTLDVPAQLIGNRTMIPLRLPLESVGFYLDWDNLTRTAIVSTSLATRPALRPGVGAELGFGNSRIAEMQYGARHELEYTHIPQLVWSRPADIAGFVTSKDADGLLAVLGDAWDNIASQWIREDLLHIGSDRNVDLSDASSRSRAFSDYGLTQSFHIQNISFETINPTTTAALIELSDTGWFLISTFVAVVHDSSSGLRIFVLERDNAAVFLCRLHNVDGRDSISVVDNSRNAFVGEIREYYS